MIMRKSIAFGLFVISMLFGSAFVITGTVMEIEPVIWIGMIMITLGILNLAIQVTGPAPAPHVTLKVVQPKKIRKKTTVKRKVVKKKKSVKRKIKKKPAKKKVTRKKTTKRKKTRK